MHRAQPALFPSIRPRLGQGRWFGLGWVALGVVKRVLDAFLLLT